MKHAAACLIATLVLLSSPVALGQEASKSPPRTPGITVLGDKDSPLGVSIVPWRNAAARGGSDRPARLLSEALLPLVLDEFRREMLYHHALSEHPLPGGPDPR